MPQQTKKQKPPVKQSSSEDRGVESPGIPGGGGGESGLSKAEMKKIRREKQVSDVVGYMQFRCTL